MSIKQALEKAPVVRPCKFKQWLESLNEEDREAVDQAMENKAWSLDQLTKVLQSEGAPVNYSQIRKHRINICSVCINESQK